MIRMRNEGRGVERGVERKSFYCKTSEREVVLVAVLAPMGDKDLQTSVRRDGER